MSHSVRGIYTFSVLDYQYRVVFGLDDWSFFRTILGNSVYLRPQSNEGVHLPDSRSFISKVTFVQGLSFQKLPVHFDTALLSRDPPPCISFY